MDVHQTISVLDEMSSTLDNEGQMVDNVMTVFPIELCNTTGTNIQSLNSYCLLEIFSSNLLTLTDLCSLAETCKRFKQIAQCMFPNGFAIKRRRFESMYTFSSKNHGELICTFEETERIVNNFAPRLTELCMEEHMALVNLLTQYRDDITLKRLEIRALVSIELVMLLLNPVFRQLQQFSVRDCDLLQIVPWDMNFDSLFELEIERCANTGALLRNTFPLLERFCFDSNDFNNIEVLGEFVRRHGCLKSVEIYREPDDDVCKFLHALSCSCNELVELTLQSLRYDSFDISHLQNLAKLTVLNIGIDEGQFDQHDQPKCEDIDFSRAFQSLNRMEISFDEGTFIVPNQIFDVLSRVQSLRELKLVHCDLNHIPWTRLTQLRKVHVVAKTESSYGPDMLDVIVPLINLEEFTLSAYRCRHDFMWPLTEEEFSKIVKVVERRVHVLTLRCHYNFTYEENCNEKRNVKLIKKQLD